MKKRFVSIQSRVTLVMVISFIVIIAMSFGGLHLIMIDGYTKLENASVTESVNRANSVVDNKVKRMKELTVDWAVWDDMYAFAQGQSPEFIANTLPESSYRNLDLNVILFLNAKNEVLFMNVVDLGTNKPVADGGLIKGPILDAVKTYYNPTENAPSGGILSLKQGPMALAMHPILTSDGQGPSAGCVVFGRYLDDAFLKAASRDLKLDIGISHATKGHPVSGDIRIEPLNADQVAGYRALTLLEPGTPVVLGVTVPRSVMKLGLASETYMLGFISLMVLALILMISRLLRRIVIKKLVALNTSVNEVVESKDLSLRIDLPDSNDEIYNLTEQVNDMLMVTEGLTDEIKAQNENLEAEVAERTMELSQTNRHLEAEIIERKRMQAEVTHLAYHDALTGLPNRLLMVDRVEQAIISARRLSRSIAVMFIDLDGFKIVNDTMGHDQGDVLLKEVARRITNILRKDDTVCRIGGDEFIILANRYVELLDLHIVIQKIITAINQPFYLNDQEFFVTCSMGVAQFPIDGEDVETLIKNADIAMYEAKANGKNQYVMCTEDLKENVSETLTITNCLYHAIENGEMKVYYQPQVRGVTNEITGVEALLRWHHPELGNIPPSKFIPIAEKTRQILSIGEWVLRTACEQNRQWKEKGYLPLRLAVNFSIYQINNPKIVDLIQAVLAETGIEPEMLEVEITESVAMDKSENMNQILRRIKDLGVTISIDDFGTEYSSLSRLKHLPVDRIKIDMSFIQGINVSDKDEVITKAIILMAKNLGMSTIAEGVETVEQLDFLNQRMCDEMQGFYLHRPLPPEEIELLLEKVQG